MAADRENERYYELMGSAPGVQQSAETAQAAAALAAAEQAAQRDGYSGTADARLDAAINEVLRKSGYHYDVGSDRAYREFAKEYSQNALRGRSAAQETANGLSGGYAPTYADAVGSATAQDIASNIGRYAPAFRAAAQQEASAREAQAVNAAQLLGSMDQTEYSRYRDTQGDLKNYISYLAGRYGTERQNDVQQGGLASEIYRAQLGAAQNNLNAARQTDNARYLHDTQSAESAAKLAADRQEFGQKMAYTAAKDAYDERKAAATAAAKIKTEAEKLEKKKKDYAYDAYKIQKHLTDGKFSEKDRFYLDYNQDGSIDSRDLAIAAQAAKTGEVTYNFEPTEGAAYIIKMAESHKNKNYAHFDKYLEELINKYRVTNGEAAYIYQYFGM